MSSRSLLPLLLVSAFTDVSLGFLPVHHGASAISGRTLRRQQQQRRPRSIIDRRKRRSGSCTRWSVKRCSSKTALSSSLLSLMTPIAKNPSFRAAAALLVSASAGFLTDTRLSNKFGILTTLVTAATLSNMGWVPSVHPYYDVCWSWFLPASLALLLLSFRTPNVTTPPHNADQITDNHNDNVSIAVRAVSLPFAIASIGSFFGCALSFFVCKWKPQLWLPPTDAAIAAGCLCASYIGGSVNFFHAATVLSRSSSSTATSSTHQTGNAASLLSSMAAADLIVMAIYFAFLTSTVNSRWLQRLFDKEKTIGTSNLTLSSNAATWSDTPIEESSTKNIADVDTTGAASFLARRGAALSLAVALAAGIVVISNRVEATLAHVVPGTGCAAIALMACFLPWWIPSSNALWTDMQRVGAPLSQFSFLLLFSSVGVSANIGQALQTGPACLCFSMLALCIHVFTTLVGSVLVRPWNPCMRLEDVFVASNAAIGGPATAAAFAGTLSGRRHRGWIVAATVWGVVGYAIATGVGVAQTRLLQGFL